MILLFFSIMAVLLSLALFVKAKQNYRGNYYLAVFFLISALWGLVTYGVFFSNSSTFAVIMTGHLTPILFLSGQALYFYIRSVITDDYRLKKSDWWHLVPYGIILLSLMPYYFYLPDEKMEIVNQIRMTNNLDSSEYLHVWPWTVSMLLRPIYYLVYVLLSSKLLHKFEFEIKQKRGNRESYYRYFTIWINFLLAAISMIAGFFVFLNMIYVFYPQTNHHIYLQMIESLIVFIFALLNLSYLIIPTLSFGLPKAVVSIHSVEGETLKVDAAAENLTNVQEISLLTEDYLKTMKEQIDAYLEEKPYIQQNFSKVNLSAATNIPLHHLSYFFNQVVEKSFAEWRNELRIEFAIEMIKDGKARLLTLDTIAKDSGFSNQTTFISSFKKYTGTTPNNFVKGSHVGED